eukprot:Rhum_TRINITY_DN3266_c0_g1::Rhum_TRINITY_DN3266_c0_g1_i1::g.10144::m.10144/K07304/msrA; peptide-methionine (S)-S-oxide reductase
MMKRSAVQLCVAGATSFKTMSGLNLKGVGVAKLGTNRVTGKPMEGPWLGCRRALFQGNDFWRCEHEFLTRASVEVSIAGYCGYPHGDRVGDDDGGGSGGGGDEPASPGFGILLDSAASPYRECVQVVYDPAHTSYAHLLYVFWTSHNSLRSPPCRVGARKQASAIFYFSERQRLMAEHSRRHVEAALGRAPTTAVCDGHAAVFFAAEERHQQHHAKSDEAMRAVAGLREVRRAIDRQAFLADLQQAFSEETALFEEEAL